MSKIRVPEDLQYLLDRAVERLVDRDFEAVIRDVRLVQFYLLGYMNGALDDNDILELKAGIEVIRDSLTAIQDFINKSLEDANDQGD